jgi:LacI family transcriptional regulator
VATLHDRQVDALLVIAPDLSEYRPVEVMSATPTILVNCFAPHGGLTSIVADEYAAGAAAARVLIDAGHRSIGVLTGSLDAMDSRLRLEGIEATVAAQRIGISVQRAADQDIKSGFAAASALAARPSAPTALICIHERLALGATLAAASLNVDIPTELSLVSLEDGEQLASQLVPRLTTIERPDRAMAEQAVTMTLQRFDADSESISHLSFSCSAALRDSVVDPRRQLNRRPVAQPIGADCPALHDPAAADRGIGARGMAGSPVKGLDDAAVDKDPGRGGGRSLRGGHEFIHSLSVSRRAAGPAAMSSKASA